MAVNSNLKKKNEISPPKKQTNKPLIPKKEHIDIFAYPKDIGAISEIFFLLYFKVVGDFSWWFEVKDTYVATYVVFVCVSHFLGDIFQEVYGFRVENYDND